MADMEATEEMADMEATEEMADMEATEEMGGMDDMEDVELATYEGAYSFDYPADFEVLESATSDLVTLTRDGQRIVVVGPDAYAAIVGAQEFGSDTEALAFYLNRVGYTVGEETSMMMGLASYEISLPRNDQVGAATLVDLDNGRQGVVIELGSDADNVPGAEGAGIMGSIVYPADLVDVAVSTEGFSTLVTAVQTAGLEDTLRSGEYTVFAPTNDAFAAALEALELTAEELLADTELLTSVLTYHVVEGTVTSDMLEDGMEVTTLNGETLIVNVSEDGVTVTDGIGNTYNVTMADVTASNGVIHVIDGVLLPPADEEEMEMTEEPVMEETEEAAPEATEEAAPEATEEADGMGEMEATEEVAMEATEEMADMEATEEMGGMDDMEDVELATYEGAYSFDYPADFEVLESATSDLVTLTRDGQRIVVVGPDAYAAIVGAQEFGSDTEALAFYLNRVGYTVGEETSMMMGLASYEISLPRNDQVGAATLVDLDNGRQGVVIELGSDADNVPGAEGAGIMGSIVYPADLVDVAVSTEGFSTLVTAVQTAGLEDTLRSGEYTVFAPTNDAFAAALEALELTAEELLADTELLTSVLTYHVVEGTVTSDMLEDGMEVTTLNGETLIVNVSEDGVTVTDGIGNTYNVTMADVTASNGVIHVIDGVLLPPADEEEMEMTEEPVMEETEEAAPEATEEADMGSDMSSIAGLAVETRELSSLAAALLPSELFTTLDEDGEYTVFAPTNEAFSATLEALDMEFADLAADEALLTSILTYHVVEGTVTSDMLEDGMEVETLNGAILTVNVSEDGVTLTDSAGNTYNVVTPDVMASNGVVHIIDGVLLPPME